MRKAAAERLRGIDKAEYRSGKGVAQELKRGNGYIINPDGTISSAAEWRNGRK